MAKKEPRFGKAKDWAIGIIGGALAIFLMEFALGRLVIRHADPVGGHAAPTAHHQQDEPRIIIMRDPDTGRERILRAVYEEVGR